MDRIIAEISVIEDESVKIMEDANEKKQEISDAIKKETEQFDRDLEDETAKRIANLRENQERDMKEKLEAQRTTAGQVLKALEEHYESHRTAYVEQMFREMTGV